MRANTQSVQQGEQETSGAGEGRKKTVWNRDMRRHVEGRRMLRGTWGKQDGHSRDFQKAKQGI